MKIAKAFSRSIIDRLIGYFEEIITNISPNSFKLPFFYYFQHFKGVLEPEIQYIEELVPNRKCAIDIGANKGMYAYALSKLFDVVEVFEPQPLCTKQIKDYNQRFKNNINIYNVALSSKTGVLDLKLPICKGLLRRTYSTVMATFEEMECEYECLSVDVHKLDDYNFQNVSFIKIDVQGHEREVLKGAKATILREKPLLLVEIEQQFLPDISVNDVFDEILSMGYDGQFMYDGKFYSIAEFSVEQHQKPGLDPNSPDFQNIKKYANNFIFKPVIKNE